MTLAAALATTLALLAAALVALPGLAGQSALRLAHPVLWLATLALAMASAPDGGIAPEALTLAAGLLGAQLRMRDDPLAVAAHDGASAGSAVSLGTWLALPWLFVAALQPVVMPQWSGGAQVLPAFTTLAAALAISSALPTVVALAWRWRLLVAVGLAFAPILGPIELRDAWLELPNADGASAALRASGQPDMGQWPSWIGWAWDAPVWLAVTGIAAMLAARPRIARVLWGFAGALALAASVGAASMASNQLQARILAIRGAEGALRVVGDAGVGLGPGMARVGLLLLLLALLDPRLRGRWSHPSALAWPRVAPLAALVSASVWLALGLWAPAAIGAMWPLDPASAALAVMTLAAIGGQLTHRDGLVTVYAIAQLGAAFVLVGGGSGWRVASAWMP